MARAALAGSFPASLLSSRIANTGTSSAIISASDTIASGHGRACTISLHRRHAERAGPRPRRRRRRLRAPLTRGAGRGGCVRGRTSRGPKRDSSAGSSVSEATSVEQHGDHGGDRQPVHERDPGGEHAEQGDHNGRAGEQDRAPGGVHRLDHRALHVAEREVALAEAGDDEQRIVDPDAEADHQRQIGRDVRHVRDVGGQPDQRHPGDQAQAGRDQRHPGRGQRAERDQQDDQRREHPDLGGGTDAEALGRSRPPDRPRRPGAPATWTASTPASSGLPVLVASWLAGLS